MRMAETQVFPGENSWSFDLVTASIEGVIDPPEGTDPAARMTFEAERGELTLQIAFSPDGEAPGA